MAEGPRERSTLRRLRPLGLFWGALLVLAGMGAGTLAYLGPPPPPSNSVPPKPAARAALAPPPAGVVASLAAPRGPLGPAPLPLLLGKPIPPPDPGLEEAAPDFPGHFLPRIGADGRKPARLYAAATDPTERHPRIALLVEGMGLNQELGAEAQAGLPAAVDFVFSGYAPEPQATSLAAAARAAGRECLVSIPMEPAGYPLNEEGVRALRANADTDANRLDLEWALSRLRGCVGATGASDGMAGERFAAAGDYPDMLAQIAGRGLIYVDPRPAGPAGPARRAVDVVIDAPPAPGENPSADAIDAKLAELSRDAAEHGSAIGLVGPLHKVTLDRLLIWVHQLAANRLVLTPASGLIGGGP